MGEVSEEHSAGGEGGLLASAACTAAWPDH